MKTAIISDIHGNDIALQAVLADAEQQGCDQIVCLGDVAASGPQPVAVIERLQALDCPVVMGNTDAFLLDPKPYGDDDERRRIFSDVDMWSASQLTEVNRTYLRGFQATQEIDLGGERHMLCFHGSPRSYHDVILATTPETEIEEIFGESPYAVFAGGHTHTQMLRRYRASILINPGSVGLPFEHLASGETVRNPPWAEYAIIESASRLRVMFQRVPIDTGALRAALRASGMPHLEIRLKGLRD